MTSGGTHKTLWYSLCVVVIVVVLMQIISSPPSLQLFNHNLQSNETGSNVMPFKPTQTVMSHLIRDFKRPLLSKYENAGHRSRSVRLCSSPNKSPRVSERFLGLVSRKYQKERSTLWELSSLVATEVSKHFGVDSQLIFLFHSLWVSPQSATGWSGASVHTGSWEALQHLRIPGSFAWALCWQLQRQWWWQEKWLIDPEQQPWVSVMSPPRRPAG